MQEQDGCRGDGQSAAALEVALDEAVAREATLQTELKALLARRDEVLLSGTDADVDKVEVELNAVTRRLDRLDLRIPLLRARHAEQLAAETAARRDADFEVAVVARLGAAAQVDQALERLGAALRLLDNSGRRLRLAGAPLGSTAERDLLGAVRLSSPLAERMLGIPYALSLEPRSLADVEAERWNRVRRASGTSTVAPARKPEDRAPPLQPIAANELERSGRYGQPAATMPVRLGDGRSDTDGEFTNVGA